MLSARSLVVPILVGCFVFVAHAKLPSFVTPCKIKHPSTVATCVKENFEIIKPHLKETIKEFHLAPLVPFHIPEVFLDATDNLKIKLENVDIYNLDASEMKDAVLDYNAPNIDCKVDVLFQQITIIGTYDIDGQILILPIRGHGPANITINNFHIIHSFTLEPLKRKGKDFMKITNQNSKYTLGRVYLGLDNLFNGDKTLGDQVNQFLNENWAEVAEVIKPSFTQTLIAIIGNIFESATGVTPMDEFFDWSD